MSSWLSCYHKNLVTSLGQSASEQVVSSFSGALQGRSIWCGCLSAGGDSVRSFESSAGWSGQGTRCCRGVARSPILVLKLFLGLLPIGF